MNISNKNCFWGILIFFISLFPSSFELRSAVSGFAIYRGVYDGNLFLRFNGQRVTQADSNFVSLQTDALDKLKHYKRLIPEINLDNDTITVFSSGVWNSFPWVSYVKSRSGIRVLSDYPKLVSEPAPGCLARIRTVSIDSATVSLFDKERFMEEEKMLKEDGPLEYAFIMDCLVMNIEAVMAALYKYTGFNTRYDRASITQYIIRHNEIVAYTRYDFHSPVWNMPTETWLFIKREGKRFIKREEALKQK